MRSGWSWIGWGVALGLIGWGAWGAEPDPEEVRRRMEIYLRDSAAEGAAKKAPAPKPRPKVEPAPKPQPKPAPAPAPAPAVDHDHEAWKAAAECGTAACFEAYLEEYPKGRYARMARARLKSESDAQPAVVTERPVPAARGANRRFIDNSDGTVTDNQSGLIWLKNANCFGRQDWSAAMASARSLASGACGLRDRSVAGQWRLPSTNEWKALIDNNARDPALPSGHPFTGVQYPYWSSTINAGITSYAWGVHLHDGNMNADVKSGTFYVWPVRRGR